MTQSWTPYAHEAMRTGRIRRRRAVLAVLAITFALLWFGYGTVTGDRNTSIGTTAGGNQISFNLDDAPKDKPVTVGIRPGGTAVMGDALDTNGGTATPPRTPERPRGLYDEPFTYSSLMLVYGPALVALLLGLRLFRGGPGKLDELNFGIYKGALPLEMLTASSRGLVFTSAPVNESIFGKGRDDYVDGDGGDARVRATIFESVRDPVLESRDG